MKKTSKGKAILVVSFGTSYSETRKATIEACEERIIKTFPEYEVRRAFTSQIIINKLKKRDGIFVDNPREALTKLKKEGFSEVYVQPLHIINGAEYEDIAKEIHRFKNEFVKLALGRPLLTSIEDYKRVVAVLAKKIPRRRDDEGVVFMGHGTYHHANSAYACLDYAFKDQGENNVFVGTVEGFPEIKNIIKKLRKKNIKKITLIPLMLVAGDHAQNDMAGDDKDSWKNIFEVQGYKVDIILCGLGQLSGIQDIYVEHLKKIME